MKKIRNLMLGLMCITILFCFSGCEKNKTAISAEEFKAKMEEKDFIIENTKEQYSSHDEIIECYAVAPRDLSYQIEFIVLDTSYSASSMYSHNKDTFEAERNDSNVSAQKDISVANYSKYTAIVNGKYKVISRIDNTLVYVNAGADYKDDVNSLLDEIGY